MDEQNTNTPSSTLPQRPDRGAERKRSRQRLLAAQDWLQKASLENPRVKYRYALGFQEGTLHPSLEKALLDIAWGGPAQIDKRLTAALGTGAGLFTILLRKALNVDPLTEAKPVEGQVIIEQPEQPTLPLRASIVPPSRPKRAQGKATLKPGEEELI